MMKLTIYVEPHDPRAEAHIDHLEAERKSAGSALNKLVLDTLSDPARLKDMLSLLGIGGSRGSLDPLVAGTWANAAGQPFPSAAGMQQYRRKAIGGPHFGQTVASVVEEGPGVFSWYTEADGSGSSPTLVLAVEAADNSLASAGYDLMPGLLDAYLHGWGEGQKTADAPSPAPAAPVPEAPSPSEMVSDAEAAMLRHASALNEGEGAFDALARVWVSNYGVENAPQPDRQGALMACFSGHGRAASLYIRERGGLAGACIDSIVRQSLAPADEAVQLGKHVALNMVQVGSALGVPLDTLLERSMFSRELTPEPPAPGTLPPEEFDRSKLPLPTGADVGR